ncbi:homocysteine S-methyltransferase family protein [Bacillus pacificus]
MKLTAEEGWVNIIGGCCGTTPEHIKAMKSALTSLNLVNSKRERTWG